MWDSERGVTCNSIKSRETTPIWKPKSRPRCRSRYVALNTRSTHLKTKITLIALLPFSTFWKSGESQQSSRFPKNLRRPTTLYLSRKVHISWASKLTRKTIIGGSLNLGRSSTRSMSSTSAEVNTWSKRFKTWTANGSERPRSCSYYISIQHTCGPWNKMLYPSIILLFTSLYKNKRGL